MTHIGKFCCRQAIGALLGLAVALGSALPLAAQGVDAPPPAPVQKFPVGPASSPPVMPATEYFLKHLSPNATLQSYLDRLRQEFRIADADGNDEISEADAVLHGQMTAASFRAIFIASLLRADLNNDGAVSEEELRATLRYQRRLMKPLVPPGSTDEQQLETQIRQIMVADTDHDGKVTIEEARNYIASRPENASFTSASGSVRQLLALRPEGKAVLTLADFEAAAEKLFREVDTDGNGTVSADELNVYRLQHGKDAAASPSPPVANQDLLDQLRLQKEAQERREEFVKQRAETQRAADEERAKRTAETLRLAAERRAQMEAATAQRNAQQKQRAEEERAKKETELRAACAMPKASDAAKVVLVGSYGPEALSSATIGSQDLAVRTGVIDVEPGKEPLYLVVTSFDPAIWRLRGAVGRIERLVLATGRPERTGELPQDKSVVGATNIGVDRITFLPPGKCIKFFFDAPSGDAAVAAAAVISEVGKGIATIAGRYSFSAVAVPSGRMHSLSGPGEGKTLVIQQTAGTLKVLGSSKNIVVQAGAIDPKTNLHRFSPGGVVIIDPKSVVASLPVEKYDVLPQEAGLIQLLKEGKVAQNRSGEYLIKKKIRFPAALVGAHLVKFLLLRGVPQPDGDPGHSTVISEETGDKLKLGAVTR
jgi:Ca2+-binding EF-hand superfamily protein